MAEICGTVVHFKVYNDAVKIVVVLFTNIFSSHIELESIFCGNFFGRDHHTKPNSNLNQHFNQGTYSPTRATHPPPPHHPNNCAMFLRKTLPPVKTGCGVTWYCRFDHSTLHPSNAITHTSHQTNHPQTNHHASFIFSHSEHPNRLDVFQQPTTH